MRLTTAGVVLLASLLAVAPVSAAPGRTERPATVERAAVDRRPASAADKAAYGEREKQAGNLQEFEGGRRGGAIATSTIIIVLLVVIIVLIVL